MKRLIIVVGLILFTLSGRAQTFDEWFHQKQTQKKYLLQQLAALQVYIGFLQKGYSVAQKGLAIIGGLSKGEFSLHELFFNSLWEVSPQIKNIALVKDILINEYFIEKILMSSNTLLYQQGFTPSEEAYVKNVFNNLRLDVHDNEQKLLVVITSQNLQMNDAERIDFLNKLFQESKQQHIFCQYFTGELQQLSQARSMEEKQVAISKMLNDIK